MTAKFTVDTHLFRELGELLVGRDSTALIELIKNAYDADATQVTVTGLNLDDPERGEIIIADNGTGMSPAQFQRGFLRIASRTKEEGERKSGKFKRRFTGAKGIGRLAAHKLARVLTVESDAENGTGVVAKIDWDVVEDAETLDDLGPGAVDVQAMEWTQRWERTPGTTLKLSKLRREWTAAERARFFGEVQSFAPPELLLLPLPADVVEKPLLFDIPLVRQADASDASFRVQLEGEFAGGEDYWRIMAKNAAWVIEIRCSPGEAVVHYAIAPTQRTLATLPAARMVATELPHPDPANGPFFDARVFVRRGTLAVESPDQRAWAGLASGVRIYMEGFRVLPYGEAKNDWLGLDASYTRRLRTLDSLKNVALDELEGPPEKDEGLHGLPNNNYFGGVFVVHAHATTLRALVNREGFVPEAGYDHLADLVRTGIDLSTRVSAAAGQHVRTAWREARRPGDKAPPAKPDRQTTRDAPRRAGLLGLKSALAETKEVLLQARTVIVSSIRNDAGKVSGALADDARTGGEIPASTEAQVETVERIDESVAEIESQAELTDERISELSMIRVLASVGTQMSAFVHEIRGLLGNSQALERALGRICDTPGLPKPHVQKLREVLLGLGDLRRGLEREASFLTEIVTPDARRRRSRQKLAERFDLSLRVIAQTASRKGIRVDNQLPPDLKSPPMFPAELTAIFSNLLTNAVKAAGPEGHVQAMGHRADDGRVHVILQNTGVAVDLAEAERWFQPFESTTAEVDPVLGQGMGLGLPITRRLLEEYGAEIAFVPPVEPAFATAIEVVFPGEG